MTGKKIKINWGALKSALISILKSKLFEWIVTKLLTRVVGFKAWLLYFALDKIWKYAVNPLLIEGEDQVELLLDKRDGRIRIQKIDKAKRENNEQDYIDFIIDI